MSDLEAVPEHEEHVPIAVSAKVSAEERRRLSQQAMRKGSIMVEMGREGTHLIPKLHEGKTLAVFTSGGDAQGMNGAVRAVVRMGLYLGCRVYFIKEGYQGMVDGDQYIVEATWNSVSDIIQRGGTIIGSARCMAFKERSGRMKACENLLKRNITNLVCIGGDGSLTGANQFRIEWPELVKELVNKGSVPAQKLTECPNINIVGLVGSIDNDFCGTDMTIGADSALHRIVDAVDAVVATAQSHQRCFVIEVMGRHCGYLALVAGLATEADWVFMPEWPPDAGWQEKMCEKLSHMREQGSRTNIIIVAEGAIDREGKEITATQVQNVITEKLKYDTRITVLGHVQRGGNPSAFDRLLGTRMGAEAVLALLEMRPESHPVVISTDGNQMVRVPLMQCVERTKEVQKAMDEKDWDRAVKLRGRSFQRNLETYKLLTRIRAPTKKKPDQPEFFPATLAVMNLGAPACGLNAAVRSFVRVCLFHHCQVYGIHDSFEGLMKGKFVSMQWNDVQHWVMYGGSFLGTQKQIPDKDSMPLIAEQLKKFKIQALLILGGFEAFHSAVILANNRDKFEAFCIPMVVIPVTISNNVPGTSFSLGSDTALNEICQIIDKIKQSATGTKRRVFIIETMGGYCGYLATLSALASGADNAYIYEEPFSVNDIKEDVEVIAQKMEKGVQRYLIIRSECANDNYSTDFIKAVFAEEGKNIFSTRINVLGHVQQGGSPTPFDRNQATKMAARAAEHLLKQVQECMQPDGTVKTVDPTTATLLGLVERYVMFSPVQKLAEEECDFKLRLPTYQWWMKLRPLLRILAKHNSNYETESVETSAEKVGQSGAN